MKHILLPESKRKKEVIDLASICLKSNSLDSKPSFSSLKNLWIKDGCLQVRPGFLGSFETLIHNGAFESNETIYYDRSFISKDESVFALYAVAKKMSSSQIQISSYNLRNLTFPPSMVKIYLTGNNIKINNIMFIGANSLLGYSNTFMLIAYTADNQSHTNIYELNGRNWVLVPTTAFYKPTVLLLGRGNNASSVEDLLKDFGSPYGFEAKGILGGMKAYFTTDGVSDIFKLPYGGLTSNEDEKITVTVGDKAFEIGENNNYSSGVVINGETVYAKVDRSLGIIKFENSNQNPYYMPFSSKPNNMEVIFYKTDKTFADNFFASKKNHTIINNRLYFMGYSGAKNKLFYSGIQDGFYLSEENTISVGEDFDAVTAVSEQNKYSVIFKKNSLYRATVTESGVSLSEAIGSKKPQNSIRPKFSITRINSNVGCDCPDTVAFVSNRLFWANTDRKVYTLFGSNTYTEGNVYEISQNIDAALSKFYPSDFLVAFAGEYQGYYILCMSKSIFIMDGNIASLRFLSSETDQRKNICWYIWDVPQDSVVQDVYFKKIDFGFIFKKKFNNGDVLYGVLCEDAEDIVLSNNYNSFKVKPIEWEVTLSKRYIGDKAVKIYGGSIDISNLGDAKITVEGDGRKAEFMLMPNGSPNINNIKTENFYCFGKPVKRLGVSISGQKEAFFDKLILDYSETGY